MKDAGILEGDFVVVRPQETAADGEIVVALVGEEATVKRFFKENDHIRLQPENATMEPIRRRTCASSAGSSASSGACHDRDLDLALDVRRRTRLPGDRDARAGRGGGRTAAPRAAEGRGGGRSTTSSSPRGRLSARAAGRLPGLRRPMQPRYGAGPAPVGGRCTDCGRRSPDRRAARRGGADQRCRGSRSASDARYPDQAGQAVAAGEKTRRGKSGHHRARWSGHRPGETRGKVPQKHTADGAAARASRTGKVEMVR